MINLSISGYFDSVCHRLDSICMCLIFSKFPRLTLYLKTRLYNLIIHDVFGKIQGSTSTGDLNNEDKKYLFECSRNRRTITYITCLDIRC